VIRSRSKLSLSENVSFADGVIAFYDAKYTYNFWRPVTAIRAAATDGNPETEADPNWLPEVGNTTPDPSYPGAHAVQHIPRSRRMILCCINSTATTWSQPEPVIASWLSAST
jgi:hypothetical protein